MSRPSSRTNVLPFARRGEEVWWGELPSRTEIADALRAGVSPTDRVFDRFLPPELRLRSGQYWTPLVVAIRAAQWLDELRVRSVIDIGSGAGKFCVAAALAGQACFTGIEQRHRLVGAARGLARSLGVEDRVAFVHGAFGTTPLSEPDAYYLYNPFGENLFGPEEHLDQDVELSHDRYLEDIALVEEALRQAPVGTLLLTYNGFGGYVPATFREERVDRELPNVLRLWRKTTAVSAGSPHLADADDDDDEAPDDELGV